MVYGDFKDLNRRKVADKVFRNKAFNIGKIPRYDGYQDGLGSVVYKKLQVEHLKMKLFVIKNQQKNYTNQKT